MDDQPATGPTLNSRQLPTKRSRAQARLPPLSAKNTSTANRQNSPRENTPTHPTLPWGLRYKFEDVERKVVSGVRASRVIDMGEKFGPYTGTLLEEEAGMYIGSTWEVLSCLLINQLKHELLNILKHLHKCFE